MHALGVQALASQGQVTSGVLLNWVESRYPDLFPTFGSNRYETIQFQGVDYYAREYFGPAGPRYLGVTRTGAVFGYGDFTGNSLQSFGVIDDWSQSVQADRCSFDRHTCAQGMLGRRWQVPKLIASGSTLFASGSIVFALDDLGNTFSVYLKAVDSNLGVFATSAAVGTSGAPMVWSEPKRIDLVGGRPVATPLSPNFGKINALVAAPGGDAVVIFNGRGGCTPNEFDRNPSTCFHYYAVRYSAKSREWAGAIKFAESPLGEFGSALIPYLNDRGDLAILGEAFVKGGGLRGKRVRAVYLSTGTEQSFRRVIIDSLDQGSGGSLGHAMGIDDNGSILYVASNEATGQNTVSIFSGKVTAGLGSAVEMAEARGRFLGVAVGRGGEQAIALDLQRLAVRKSPTDPFAIRSTGSDGFGTFRGLLVSDVGEILQFEQNISGPRYQVLTLADNRLATIDLPALFPFGSNAKIAVNRRGDVVAMLPDGNCGNGAAFAYNRATNEMTSLMGWMGSSSTVTGRVSCPQTLYRFGDVQISLNGVAVASMLNEYVTIPTSTSAGTVNSSANNSWLAHLR